MSVFHLPPEELMRLAQREGFGGAGIVGIAAGEPDEQGKKQGSGSYFEDWIAHGRAGEMEYLKRRNDAGVFLRSEVRAAFPWANSVIVCAANYNSAAPLSIDPAPPETGWIARYAWSGRANPAAGDPGSNPDSLLPSDYHDVLLTRLRSLEARLKDLLGPFESRAYVDTGPLIERSFAQQAGIGWTGKNTCVLNQELGSWLFLGVIVTSLSVAPDAVPTPAVDRCGTCRRCIDACPTEALTAPREMDATRCISYLTIEKRGVIAEELRAPMGRQIFGCDICQDVCPWNTRSSAKSPAPDADLTPRPQLINPSLEWLAMLDAAAFNRLFRGSPIKRAKHAGLRRNVAIAMGNSSDERFLPQLKAWSTADDPVLAETAQWAMRRLRPITAGIAHEEADAPAQNGLSASERPFR
ncbi:MAG: tRNA epoxyqueuosine(34) reductase QueG [Acidobacteriaceae bacterium]